MPDHHSAPAERTLAVIDIGTNSAKLMIARVRPDTGAVTELRFATETTRIGEGCSSTGQVAASALFRTVSALQRYRNLVEQFGCEASFAFSTEALRIARNTEDVVRTIAEQTGLEVRVLSAREEARFAYLSARMRLPRLKAHALLFDVGGGSTEVVWARGEEILVATSLPLGALHLTESYLRTDPIDPREFDALRTHVRETVVSRIGPPVLSNLRARAIDLVASGGSITTLRDMRDAGSAGPALVSPKLRIGDVRRLEKTCLALTLARRKRVPGLDPDRADIIPAGLAIVLAFMESTGKRVLTVNPGGVREGVLVHVAQNDLRW